MKYRNDLHSRLDNNLRTAKGTSKISLILLAYAAFIALEIQDGLLGIA